MAEDFWRDLKEDFFKLRRECPLYEHRAYFGAIDSTEKDSR